MANRKDLLIVVPARAGSKRLPQKNVRALAGKSLLARTAEAIVEAGLDAPVLLSTDGERIAAEGERLGWLVPFRRPDNLATDDATTDDVVLHALDHFAGGDPAQVMVLQPTSPLRGGACLRAAVDLLARRDDVDAVIGMAAMQLPPTRLFLVGADGRGLTRLTTGLAENHGPAWGADGRIYFSSRTADSETIWSIKPFRLPTHDGSPSATNPETRRAAYAEEAAGE